MKTTARRRLAILDRLQTGALDVEELGAELQVSASTIRRDLAQLATEGHVLRTYGGAAMPELPIQQRATVNLAAKRAIARAAASFVREGETVMLDSGTTTGALAVALASRGRKLHVVTNGLNAMAALAEAADIELTILGGTLRKISCGTVGPAAESALRRLSANHAFVSGDGVVATLGICEATTYQAALKELMMRQAMAVYVLADAEKLGRLAASAWAPFPARWTLITDAQASADQLAPFRALPDVTILIADAD